MSACSRTAIQERRDVGEILAALERLGVRAEQPQPLTSVEIVEQDVSAPEA